MHNYAQLCTLDAPSVYIPVRTQNTNMGEIKSTQSLTSDPSKMEPSPEDDSTGKKTKKGYAVNQDFNLSHATSNDWTSSTREWEPQDQGDLHVNQDSLNQATVQRNDVEQEIPAWKKFAMAMEQKKLDVEPRLEQSENEYTQDTFSSDSKKLTHSSRQDGSSSPLKLFGNKHDTYTQLKFDGLLNQFTTKRESQTEDFVKNADDIFNGIVGNAMGKNKSEHPTMDDTSNYTSDGETEQEEASFQSRSVDKVQTPRLKEADSILYHYEEQPSPTLKKQKPRNLKFIPPDNYQNMVFDKRLNKYVKEHEFAGHRAERRQDDNDENVAALEAIDDLSTTSLNATKPEVSFRLPSDHEDTTSDMGKSDWTRNVTTMSFSNRSKLGLKDITNVSQMENVSFSQSRSKLIACLTDVKPNGRWDKISQLSLNELSLTNLKDLHEFVPNLRFLQVASNSLQFLDGVPAKIQSVDASHNEISEIAPFTDFPNLQLLDLSFNLFSNLNNLKSLYNVKKLWLNNNEINNLAGLEHLKMLTTLDLSGNKIEGEVDFEHVELPMLEELHLSNNYITSLKGIAHLPFLRILKADNNQLHELAEPGVKHKNLKKLSLRCNSLTHLDLKWFPHLRSLNLDGNADMQTLSSVSHLDSLHELSIKMVESPTIHQQLLKLGGKQLLKLHLSGSKFDLSIFPLVSKNFGSLVHLNLSAMGIKKLPLTFHHMFPQLQTLNLNFNSIESITPLCGLPNIRVLYMVSNNITGLPHVLQSLSDSRGSLRVLDMRLNPINAGFYPFVFSPQESHIADGTAPIQLDTLEDIESFEIHYATILRDLQWEKRDSEHLRVLKEIHFRGAKDKDILMKRLDYDMFLVNFLHRLEVVDGRSVTRNLRLDMKLRFNDTVKR